MADRYWVGGSGSWSSTAKWSTTSNGTSGASVPTAADNAIFDASSDSGADITVTLTGASTCLNLTMSAIDQNLTFTGAFTLSVVGNLSLSTTKTINVTGITALAMTGTTTRTITSSGGTLTGGISFTGAAGTWTLQDAFTITGTATHTAGTIAFNGFTFTAGTYTNTGTSARALNFTTAGSKFAINATTTSTVWSIASATGLTITSPTTGSVDIVGSSNITRTIATLALAEASTMNFSILATAGTITTAASNTFRNLTVNCPGATFSNITTTVYGSLSYLGGTWAAGGNLLTLAGTATNLTITGTGGALDFPITYNSTPTGAGAYTLASNVTIGATASRQFFHQQGTLNLSSFTLTVYGVFNSSSTATRTLNFGTGFIDLTLDGATDTTIWDSTTVTAYTVTNAAAGSVRVKGSGTLVRSINTGGLSEANSLSFEFLSTAGTITLTNATSRIRNFIINCSGTTVTNAVISCYGNFTYTAGTLSAGVNTLSFQATSGTQALSMGIGIFLDFPVTFSGTATYSLSSNFSIGSATSRTVTLTTGTLELNSYSLTVFGPFNPTGTGTRKIQMSGTGGKIVLSLNTGVTVYNNGTITNMTTDGNVLIQLTGGGATTKTIQAGQLSEANAISFQLSSTAGTVTFSNTNTIKNLTIDNNSFTLANVALTIYGNVTINGTAPTFSSGVNAWTFAATSAKTITTSGKSLEFQIAFSGAGGSWTLQDALTCTSVVTLTTGTLSLSTFTLTCFSFTSTGLSSRTLNFGTGKIVLTSAFTGTIWDQDTNLTVSGTSLVETTGGGATTKTINAVSTETNSVSFSLLTTAGTVTFTASNTIRDLTIGNNSFTLTNIAITIYGNLTISGTAPTLTAGVNTWTFGATSGTKTITTNGEILDFPITFNGIGGTWQLQDALTIGTSTSIAVTHTNGTISLSSYTMTIYGSYTASGVTSKTLNYGTGKIVLSLAGSTATTIWSGSSGLIHSGSGGVEVVGSGTLNRTIATGYYNTPASPNFSILVTAGTITTSSCVFRDLYLSDNAYTFAQSAQMVIYGSYTIAGTTPTLSGGGLITFYGTGNINTGGKTLIGNIQFGNTIGSQYSAACVLLSNVTTTGTFALQGGSLNLSTFNFTCAGAMSVTGAITKSLSSSGGKLITSIATASTAWNSSAATNFTTDGNIIVELTGGGATNKTVSPGTLNEANAISFIFSNTAGTVTITSGSTIENLTLSNTAFTLANQPITIYGNLLILGNTPTLTAGSSAWTFAATSAKTITTAGETIPYPLVFNGVGGSWTLQDALTVTNTITLTAGTLSAATYNMTAWGFSSSNSNTRTVNIGSGIFTLTSTLDDGATETVWDATTATNLTVTGSGSISFAYSTGASLFIGGGASYPTINAAGPQLKIQDNNTFYNITNTISPTSVLFTAGSTQTFTSDFDLNGASGNLVTIGSISSGSTFTLSKSSGTIGVSFCTISDSIATGGAIWNAYISNGNVDNGNNTGWIFVAATSTFLAFFFP
jgi:hypothetical protein